MKRVDLLCELLDFGKVTVVSIFDNLCLSLQLSHSDALFSDGLISLRYLNLK